MKKLIGYVPNESASPPLVKREALIFSGSVDADQIIARRIVTHGGDISLGVRHVRLR